METSEHWKLAIKAQKQHQWHCSSVFIVNVKKLTRSGVPLLTFNKKMPARLISTPKSYQTKSSTINFALTFDLFQPEFPFI